MGFFILFFNRTDYRGFPSKGYSIFFQRPREQLTEYNRTLGSPQFQKSSTNVVRTNRFPGRILQCLISRVGSKFNTEAAAEGTARSKRSGLILQTPCRGPGVIQGSGVMQGSCQGSCWSRLRVAYSCVTACWSPQRPVDYWWRHA